MVEPSMDEYAQISSAAFPQAQGQTPHVDISLQHGPPADVESRAER
jgi:hypothetical protein